MSYEQFQFVDATLLYRCQEFRNTLFEYRIRIFDPVIFFLWTFWPFYTLKCGHILHE